MHAEQPRLGGSEAVETIYVVRSASSFVLRTAGPPPTVRENRCANRGCRSSRRPPLLALLHQGWV
eukprot:11817694-Alexandrium_andersonii.AAC.1